MRWVASGHRAPLGGPLPARTWMLALLEGTSAVGLAAIAVAPLSSSAPTTLYAVCSCVLAMSAVGLLLSGSRLGGPVLLALAGVRIAVVAVTLAVAGNGGARLFAGAGLIWVLLWTTGFFPVRTMMLMFAAEISAVAAAVAVNADHLRTAIDALPMLVGAAVLSALLAEALASLRHEARHDVLTGLLNRRGLEQALRELWTGQRFAGTASLVVVDLDGLKLVNDHAGHLAGDQMLVTFGTELQTAARGVDLTARIGGDEFIAILPGFSAVEATRWAAKLRDSSGVAWSFGVAERGEDEELEPWLARADKLMYVAKVARRSARVRQIPAA